MDYLLLVIDPKNFYSNIESLTHWARILNLEG
jgi:hypothetical protein